VEVMLWCLDTKVSHQDASVTFHPMEQTHQAVVNQTLDSFSSS